ncbi:histidine kinase [uncultured Corynebacterium sp.]|uniref:sensor histidine kinase n=1 Tax=uncultured Corynebacterium sp. TaxID=159447 RepID=UPI00260121B3|nr:histidine kinase [uncultured Corynebacterium sp.]
MFAQRIPTTALIAALAFIFSSVGMLYERPTTPLVTALILAQAFSLILASSRPRISTTIYLMSFAAALLAGRSAGIELLLGVFLVAIVASVGHRLLSVAIIPIITLGGFYSPIEAHVQFDFVALIIFLTITALAYFLGFWVYRNYQQHQHAQHLYQTRRQQLASLLHDTIAADLTSVIMRLEKLAIVESENQEELKSIASTARSALDGIRQLLETLNARPGVSRTLSLPGTLDILTKRLRGHGFTVISTMDLSTPVTRQLHNIALERMLSEAVTNIIKYAAPHSVVNIDAKSNEQGVTLTISNARAMRREKSSDSMHLGLSSMLDNLHAVGGALKTRNTEGGWVITAHIPF